MSSHGDTPRLPCPNCGDPLITAHGREFHDDDGEWFEHHQKCDCDLCEWTWFDDGTPYHCCKCGTVAVVGTDEDYAFAREIPVVT